MLVPISHYGPTAQYTKDRDRQELTYLLPLVLRLSRTFLYQRLYTIIFKFFNEKTRVYKRFYLFFIFYLYYIYATHCAIRAPGLCPQQ